MMIIVVYRNAVVTKFFNERISVKVYSIDLIYILMF